MGFCYGVYGLCCDFCGISGHGTRKISCPYGYCQAWAVCPDCKKKKLHLYSSCTPEKKTHKEVCKPLHLRFIRIEKAKQAIIESGHFLRVAALSHGDMCKVIFRGKDKQEKAFWMTNKLYESTSYGRLATIETYQKLGIIEECKTLDIYDGEKYTELTA